MLGLPARRWLAAAVAAALPLHAAAVEPVSISSGRVSLQLDRRTGTIIRLADASRGVALVGRPDAAEAFRLILRARDHSLSAITGGGIEPSWDIAEDRATASWRGPLRDDSGCSHEIRVRVTYAAAAGTELRTWLSLENGSDRTILEAWLPTLGGLASLRGEVVASNPSVRRPLKLPFGDFAPHYPGAIPMGFVDIGGPNGLYFGAHEKLARLKLLRVMETSGDIVARITHVPYVKPGGRFSSCAGVFRFHDGGYAGAGATYRKWFVRTFGIKDPRADWIRRQSFFLMTMFMLPEGNINFRFRDIPRWAAEARKYGVRAVQLAGWQRGGHDNGYPYYEPDPRLGTWEELRAAISKCHRMGMRVFFFVNLQPAMMDLQWYRRELRGYEAQGSAGHPLWIAGWGMGTLASRIGLTTPLMAFLDPAFPRYRDALMRYFRKLASVGADGVHVDKMFPAALDANPNAPMPPDTAPWEGAIRFLTRMDRDCRAINPSWRISNECNWDRVLQVGTATWWAGNMTVVKGVFPETAETVGLYQPYDFVGVNNAVREGWVVMVAPYQFQRSMDEPTWRGLSRYIRDVKAIRDRLADAVFLGEPATADAANFTASGGSTAHRTYRDPRTGRRVCIVTNNGETPADATFGSWTGSPSVAVRLHQPGRAPVVLPLPAEFDIPPERLAFVEELPAGTLAPVRPARPSRPRAGAPSAERRPFSNTDFEGGTLDGWQADPNWTVDDNSAGGWYSGWQGRKFAWSGKGGEPRVGRLRSPVFALNAAGVEVSVAGWSDISGRTPDRWDYVTLNLEDGRELDRVYTPNTTQFTPMVLDGSGHRGARVYIEAVDDGTAETYSMICVDDVRLWDPPEETARPPVPIPGAIVLENRHYRVEIGRANGTLGRLRDKAAGIEIIREPRLSDNWRISLPIRGAIHGPRGESWRNHEGNYIQGRLQRLTSLKRTPAGIELTWAGPLRADDGSLHRAGVTMRIRAEGDALRFETHIVNHTPYEVGEVYSPILGGLQGLGSFDFRRRDTELALPAGDRFSASRPFRTFAGMSPFGVLGPEQVYAYPASLRSSWALLRAPRSGRSLYFGAHDPIARAKALHLEMVPGVAGPRGSGNWPRADEIKGRPVGVRIAWTHIVYQSAGRAFDASPVVLRCSQDDPVAAQRYYGKWLDSLGRESVTDASPVARTLGRTPFGDLPGLAADAARAGMQALVLTDWTAGGRNNGVPSFEPDPALGGWSGLRDAARACRGLGVDLILEAAANPVSQRSELYRSALAAFRCVDRWGVPQSVYGWGAPRVTAEALCAGERRVYMNPGHPGFRAWLSEHVARLAEAGLAGIRLTGMFPNLLDFNPTLATTPDRAVCEGSLATLRAVRSAARRHVPGFRVLVPERWDRL